MSPSTSDATSPVPPVPPVKVSRAGRNLPASIAVAIALIALIVVSLAFYKDFFLIVVAGAMIVQPSHAVDWKNEELRPLLDQFYRGSNGYEAVDKIKLVKLLWDAIGSEFGGRHELYERTYSGSH